MGALVKMYKQTQLFKQMEEIEMAESRLIGGYPVIGIRPTIDGRRGALDEIGRAHV